MRVKLLVFQQLDDTVFIIDTVVAIVYDIVSRQVLCQGDSHRPTTPSSDVLLNRSRTPTPAGEFAMQVRE